MATFEALQYIFLYLCSFKYIKPSGLFFKVTIQPWLISPLKKRISLDKQLDQLVLYKKLVKLFVGKRK